MKKIILLALFALSYGFLSAQKATVPSTQPDPRLTQVFDKDYLDLLGRTNSFLIQRYNFILDNGYRIVDAPEKTEIKVLPEVILTDLDHVNILALMNDNHLKGDSDKNTLYRIAGTNKLLVIYSGKYISEELNKVVGRH